MTETAQLDMSVFQPVGSGYFSIQSEASGYRLWSRHCHVGGTYGTCLPLEVDSLTASELRDVLLSVVGQIGQIVPACAPR